MAPHTASNETGPGGPPVPSRYDGVYDYRRAPRSANFNPDVPSGASWVRNLPLLNSSQIDLGDDIYAKRLGNLAAIDDMVASITDKLESTGVLDDTFVIFTSDNGWLLSFLRQNDVNADVEGRLPYRQPSTPSGKTMPL